MYARQPQARNAWIDLRSDTVTRPSAGMIAAMCAAEVGDDVWGDDPTAAALEEEVAELAGKEAGLFFPSGTQSNLAGIMAHCARGDEYIVGQQAHTYRYEGGGAAVLGSVQPQPIENEPDGSIALDKIRGAIKPDDPHFARTRLLALENTISGRVLSQSYVTAAAELARAEELRLHLDGARAWNAAIAQDATLATICAPFDSVSLCFSKGLGAPVGSALVGSAELISRARRLRKMLGGGMRQVGYLAAACRYAMRHNIQGLAEDHRRAQILANSLSEVLGDAVRYSGTNMLFIDARDAFSGADFAAFLAERGVAVAPAATLRLVTHLDITDEGIEVVINAVKEFFAKRGKAARRVGAG